MDHKTPLDRRRRGLGVGEIDGYCGWGRRRGSHDVVGGAEHWGWKAKFRVVATSCGKEVDVYDETACRKRFKVISTPRGTM